MIVFKIAPKGPKRLVAADKKELPLVTIFPIPEGKRKSRIQLNNAAINLLNLQEVDEVIVNEILYPDGTEALYIVDAKSLQDVPEEYKNSLAVSKLAKNGSILGKEVVQKIVDYFELDSIKENILAVYKNTALKYNGGFIDKNLDILEEAYSSQEEIDNTYTEATPLSSELQEVIDEVNLLEFDEVVETFETPTEEVMDWVNETQEIVS